MATAVASPEEIQATLLDTYSMNNHGSSTNKTPSPISSSHSKRSSMIDVPFHLSKETLTRLHLREYLLWLCLIVEAQTSKQASWLISDLIRSDLSMLLRLILGRGSTSYWLLRPRQLAHLYSYRVLAILALLAAS